MLVILFFAIHLIRHSSHDIPMSSSIIQNKVMANCTLLALSWLVQPKFGLEVLAWILYLVAETATKRAENPT